MNHIREQLKSKWVLFIVIMYTIYFIENILHIINIDEVKRNLIGKSEAFIYGAYAALYLKPIFDLFVIYFALFKIKFINNRISII
jgi:hypothetical protein